MANDQQNQEKILRLEKDVFTPALQEATKKARKDGFDLNDVIFAAANAYLNMLVNLMDKENALALMEDQAAFLRSKVEEKQR